VSTLESIEAWLIATAGIYSSHELQSGSQLELYMSSLEDRAGWLAVADPVGGG
jgi:hypothetical protein